MLSDPNDRFRAKIAAFLGAIGTANLFFSIFSGASVVNAGKTMSNIHWLLAGWGNVVIFVALVALLAYGPLTRRFSARNEPRQIPLEPEPVLVRRPGAATPEQSERPPVASAIPANSPREVTEAIESVPPFQHASMAKHFEGVRIKWRCHFYSADARDDGMVKIFAFDPDRTRKSVSVAFNLKQSECPGIGVLARGAEVLVRGEIEFADTTSIRLRNATMEF